MMAAEQAINLTFGHPLLDESGNPVLDDNGEIVMEHGFHMPDEAAVAQAIGIIIGMRATAKFQIWNGVEQKIAKGQRLISSRRGSNDMNLVNRETGEKFSLQEAYTNEALLKSQENKIKAQREKVAEKQKVRDATNQKITEIKQQQEAVSKKKLEVISEKAEDIAKNRNSYYENFAKKSHKDLYERYEKAKLENNAEALQNIDTELAERLILDNPATSRISYGTDKARAELSFKELQKLAKYKNNLELTQLTTGEWVISYVKDIAKLRGLEGRAKAQESELNDLHRRVNAQEQLNIQNEVVKTDPKSTKESLDALANAFANDPLYKNAENKLNEVGEKEGLREELYTVESGRTWSER
jgi:hypothetical protein